MGNKVLSIFYSKKNKRGQASELVFYGVMMFILAITILISFRLITDLNDAFQSSDVMSDTGKEIVGDFQGRFALIFDGVYIVAVVILSIVLIATVFMLDTHPIFFVLSVIAFLAVLMVNVILANALDQIGRSAALIVFYNQLPMMRFIATHWIAILSVVGFASFMAFYTKRVSSP